MKKLGLDLGSSSIGWALRENDKIEKKGVITFHSGMIKGQGGYSSPTKDRREARSKRRLIQAKKYRKWELLKILISNELVPLNQGELDTWSKYTKGQIQKFPDNKKFLKWLACDFSYLENGINYTNPYQLRVKALDDKLTKHEIGRVLYHLVQRRGYKDIGETDKETEKQKQRRETGGFQNALQNNRTIAEALTKQFLNKGERARNQYPLRGEYEEELEEICKGQGYDISKKSEDQYNDEFVQNIWKAIIWQRPLRSQKGNIGKCTLESEKPRCPVSHPIFEIFRAWSFINTIKYYNENDEKQSISQPFRSKLFDFLLKKEKNFKFEEIRNFLDKLFKNKKFYNYPIDKKTGQYNTSVSGMPVCKGLIDVFGENIKEDIATLHNYNIGNAPKINHGYSLYDLWHILFAFDEKSATNKNFLEIFSEKKLFIENKKTKQGKAIFPFAKLKNNIITGYSDLSLKAMRKIIPFLREGYLYNEAVVLAKIPELLGEKWNKDKETILQALKQSSDIFNWNKMTIAIANNLIDQYKGLDNRERFAERNFQYKLDDDDENDIKNACIGYFGEKSWENKTNKNEILTEVKNKYQTFYNDTKRAYLEVQLLTDIFSNKMKENKIEITGKLYHHSNKENIYGSSIIDKKTGFEILPESRIDSIKNPMFNKSMSILRKLINELIKKEVIDNDTEVIIELARDLNDNNKRIAIERYQNERRNKREKYREFLNEFSEKKHLSLNIEESISTFELWTEQTFEEAETDKKEKIFNKKNSEILKEKEAIKRYELWMEQKGQCIYTGKLISITQLFSNEIDIEHTIPRSLLPDNTLANQTVCYARYNRDIKANQIPTKLGNYEKGWNGYTAIINRLESWIERRDSYKGLYEERIKPKGNEDENAKSKRVQEKHYFKMHFDYWKDKVERFEAAEVKNSWARRQLVDTQMVSKYARDYLKTCFKKVAVQKGSVTADFRKIYSFQEEDEMKNRNKHTHHAIDAAVLTLIPVNSSHRDRLLKKMYEMEEKENKQFTTSPFPGFNSQKLIQDIENNTLIVNYENDKLLKQSYKNVRKRGKLQYLKNKSGEFVSNPQGKKILLKAKGDTVRSTLYKDTFVAKIRDVERYPDGQPRREGKDWKYKKGAEEFIYTVRKPIRDILSKIEDIVDPVIKDLVKKQKNNTEIKDSQGKVMRHVRIKTKAGQKVKERVNYCSNHQYKNHYYASTGSLPYAILLQKSNEGKVEREMIPVASFEIAKFYKKAGQFDTEKYVSEFYPDFNSWHKKLLKVGQKVIVLKNDDEYQMRSDIDFLTKRLYRITQFANDGSRLMLQHHLEARSRAEIDEHIKSIKDSIVKQKEIELEIPLIKEDETIVDNTERKKDLKNRFENFTKRLAVIAVKSSVENASILKKRIEQYKTEASSIDGEEILPLLKMTKANWNFLYEGIDFNISLLGDLI